MKNRFLLLLLIGGCLFGLASVSSADLRFGAPFIGRSENRMIEVGATARIDIVYTNNTGSTVNLDAGVIYMDYDASKIDQNSIVVSNPHGGNFTVIENNTGTAGLIKYQIRQDPGAGQIPLTLAAGATQTLASITYHVVQNDALAGLAQNFIRFTNTNRAVNVMIADHGPNVTGNIVDPDNAANTQISLEHSLTPQFNGLNLAEDAKTGNSVNLAWTENENTANDKREIAETLYPAGTKLRYNLYRSTISGQRGDLVTGAYNGTTYRNGPSTGIPGAGMEALSDCTTYWFTTRGQDDCTPNHNEETNLNQLSATPHDLTPPAIPTWALVAGTGYTGAAPADKTLTLSWNPNPGGAQDFAGVLLFRTTVKDAALPVLVSAGVTGPNDDGTTPPDLNATVGDWTVVYKGSGSSSTDSGLNNGTIYYYKLYAYDRAVAGPPREQGNNYAESTLLTAVPGVAPTRVQNFVALTGPITPTPGLTLNWTNAPEAYYGGTIVLGTLDVAVLEAITPTSHLAEPEQGKVTPNKTNVFLVGNFPANPDTAPLNTSVINQLNGVAIDPDKPYYFKAFSYNAGPDANWDAANLEALNAHLYGPGEIAGDRILPAGGGGTGGIYTYTLKPASSTVLAINSITIPAVANVAATIVLGGATLPTVLKSEVSKASQLIGLINEAAGRPVVNVLSKWDPSTGKGVGLTYNLGSNTFTGDDFTLAPGEGYQIFVTDEMTLVLEARRAAQ